MRRRDDDDALAEYTRIAQLESCQKRWLKLAESLRKRAIKTLTEMKCAAPQKAVPHRKVVEAKGSLRRLTLNGKAFVQVACLTHMGLGQIDLLRKMGVLRFRAGNVEIWSPDACLQEASVQALLQEGAHILRVIAHDAVEVRAPGELVLTFAWRPTLTVSHLTQTAKSVYGFRAKLTHLGQDLFENGTLESCGMGPGSVVIAFRAEDEPKE